MDKSLKKTANSEVEKNSNDISSYLHSLINRINKGESISDFTTKEMLTIDDFLNAGNKGEQIKKLQKELDNSLNIFKMLKVLGKRRHYEYFAKSLLNPSNIYAFFTLNNNEDNEITRLQGTVDTYYKNAANTVDKNLISISSREYKNGKKEGVMLKKYPYQGAYAINIFALKGDVTIDIKEQIADGNQFGKLYRFNEKPSTNDLKDSILIYNLLVKHGKYIIVNTDVKNFKAYETAKTFWERNEPINFISDKAIKQKVDQMDDTEINMFSDAFKKFIPDFESRYLKHPTKTPPPSTPKKETGKRQVADGRSEKKTPLISDWINLKKKDPDLIYLFETPEYYKTFNSDAEKIAKVLKTKVSTNSNNDNVTLSFPKPDLAKHLKAIINSGYRVAFPYEIEKPKSKSEAASDKYQVVFTDASGLIIASNKLKTNENNDYEKLAGINRNTGKITWYKLNLPDHVQKKIKDFADSKKPAPKFKAGDEVVINSIGKPYVIDEYIGYGSEPDAEPYYYARSKEGGSQITIGERGVKFYKDNPETTNKEQQTKNTKTTVQQAIKQLEAGRKNGLTEKQVLDLAEIIHQNRKKPGRKQDEKKQGRKRLAPTANNVLRWAMRPGDYDLIGIDTLRKSSPTVKARAVKKAKVFNLFGL